jgi:hypothetical protein
MTEHSCQVIEIVDLNYIFRNNSKIGLTPPPAQKSNAIGLWSMFL